MLGFQQNTQHPNHCQAFALCRGSSGPFIHQNQVGFLLDGEGQGLRLALVEVQ